MLHIHRRAAIRLLACLLGFLAFLSLSIIIILFISFLHQDISYPNSAGISPFYKFKRWLEVSEDLTTPSRCKNTASIAWMRL